MGVGTLVGVAVLDVLVAVVIVVVATMANGVFSEVIVFCAIVLVVAMRLSTSEMW